MATEQNVAIGFYRSGDVDVLRRVAVPDPQPGPGQVIVAMDFASVNPIDVKMRAGLMQIGNEELTICGRDGAGRIVALGEGADKALLGQRVCFTAPRGTGTWAQRLAIASDIVAIVPSAVPQEIAAAIPLVGTTAMALLATAGPLTAGVRVLVNGATGGVGAILTQLAKNAGCHVVAVCSKARMDDAKRLGADQVIAHNVPNAWLQIDEVDVLFDLAGGNVFEISNRILRRHGTVARVNARPISGTPRDDIVVQLVNVAPDAAALSYLLQLIEVGRLRIEIERIFEFDGFAAAHLAMAAGGKSKLLLGISQSHRSRPAAFSQREPAPRSDDQTY